MRSSFAPLPLLLLAALGAAGAAPAAETPRAAQTSGLVVVGGGNQAVAPGVPFGVAVRLVAPAPGGVPISLIRVVTSGPSIHCATATTDANGLAALSCVAGTWPVETMTRFTLGNEALGVFIDITVTVKPPFFAEGLNAIGGDRLTVLRGQDFELAVQAGLNGRPEEALRLDITRAPVELPVSCPNLAFTDAIGQARIVCTSLETLPISATVLITFRDARGRSVTFNVFIVAQDTLNDGIFKVSGDDQAVPTGSTLAFPLVAAVVIEGRLAPGIPLIVEPSDPRLLICPREVVTDGAGLAYIHCSAGPILNNGFAAIHLRNLLGQALLEPFRVSVIGAGAAIAASTQIVSSTQLRGLAGETLDEPIVIRASDPLGQPAAGVPLFFSSDLNVTFRPSVAVTGFDGEARVRVTLGCPAGRGTIRIGPRPGSSSMGIAVDILSGGPSLLTKTQGDGQSGSPGERLDKTALVVILTDRCFQPVMGQQVTWSVNPPGAATLESVVSTTDGLGRSSVLVRIGSRPGPFTVTARYQDMQQTFNLLSAPRAAGVSPVSPTRLSVPRGETSEPLAVVVRSDAGLPVPGLEVLYAIVDGPGTLTAFSTRTDADGRAATRFVAPPSFGTTRIRASVPGAAAALGAEGAGPAQLVPSVEFTVVTGGRRPVILPAGGFVNGASFRPGWTPGSLGTIFGVGLMEDISGVVAPQGPPFPTGLRGTSVTIDGHAAPILSISNVGGREQINLQVPFEVRTGLVRVVVSNNGTEAVFEGVPVFETQPGIFEVDIAGGRFAAALHADFRLVSPADPARPGETILLFLTGMGPLDRPVGTNAAGPAPAPRTRFVPVVGVNDAGAPNFGGFYAPGLATVYQVNFTVPADLQTGNHRLSVGAGGAFSQTALLPVRR